MKFFSALTRQWFQQSFQQPTPAQQGAWQAITAGNHALVIAPTGSGKTLAAFLAALDELTSRDTATAETAGTTVLYISPLKALGVDVQRNLRAPLAGLRHQAAQAGQPFPEITVGVRSGDTPAAQRRQLQRNPPDILITTPESLYLMLTSQAGDTLAGVRTVIVDEIHALAGTKRGSHLALSLERLVEVTGAEFQRIGLSATVEPADEVARFLGGQRPVTVVRPAAEKVWDLAVCAPIPDLQQPPPTPIKQPADTDSDELAAELAELGLAAEQAEQPGGVWPHIERAILDLVCKHHSSIVFANSRRLAEKLTTRLNELYAAEHPQQPTIARAHHGSVSKEHRQDIEDALKTGRLRCVVATSSLELGIDMGLVDVVVHVEAPPSVAAGLQRVGRAGHQVGAASVGRFFPKNRCDVLHCLVLGQQMLTGALEPLTVPANPLDVLAQQLVAMVAMQDWDVQQAFDVVRRAAPFTALPWDAFVSVLDLLSGKYPSTEFAQLRPRLVWDRSSDTLTARPGAQLLAVTSGGTIPDRGLFGVYLASGDAETGSQRVGELDEEMVYESRVGDIFSLGASSWRIERITHDRVLVSPAPGQPGKLPFWRGEGPARPPELGRAIGAYQGLLNQAAQGGNFQQLPGFQLLNPEAAENLITLVQEQREATGVLPTDRALIVERTRDELGDWLVILHSPYGWSVHAPWALAVGQRVADSYGMDAQVLAADDGIIVRLPATDAEPPGAELFLLDAADIRAIVTEELASSALFASRFRECSARALLLPRQNPAQRTPLWQQRQRSAQLLAVAQKYPQFPLLLETARECLQDVYRLAELENLLGELNQQRISLSTVHTSTPSPLAAQLLFGYIAQFLYAGDSPLAERRSAALALDPDLMQQLLGQVPMAELLDPDAIAEVHRQFQRLSESTQLRGEEGVADVLRLLGPMTATEISRRVHFGDAAAADADAAQPADAQPNQATGAARQAEQAAQEALAFLQRRHRVFSFTLNQQPYWAVVEDAARLRDGLGVPLPPGIPDTLLEPAPDAIEDLLHRFVHQRGPFTTADVHRHLGLAPSLAAQLLQRLVERRELTRGRFTPAANTDESSTDEYCSTEVLRLIRRRTLALLRSQLAAVEQSALARFLGLWQQVQPFSGNRSPQPDPVDALRAVIDQLAGYPAPASAWETLIFPARIPNYQPWALDELLATGQVIYTGDGGVNGHDGLISFHPSELAGLTLPLPAAEPPQLSADAAALYAVFPTHGGFFAHQLSELAQQAGTPVRRMSDALWELFFAGLIVNDSFSPARAWMGQGTTAHRTQKKPSLRRNRRFGLRAGNLPGTTAGASLATPGTSAIAGNNPAQAAATGAAASPASGGRWSRTPQPVAEPTLRGQGQVETLLNRYGVLTPGSVKAEHLPGGFSWAYKILGFFEEAGYCRRGYYVEQLGGAQFADVGAVDLLRECSTADQPAPAQAPTPVVQCLAATDPANPYGAALAWPATELGHKPGRKAGALVVLVDGELALYVERGAKTLLCQLSPEQLADSALLEQLAQELVATLEYSEQQKIHCEQLNQQPILSSPLAEPLVAAGFYRTPSGLRFRPNVSAASTAANFSTPRRGGRPGQYAS